MRTYLGIFKIRFISTIHYRTAALAGIMTQFAWGSLLILMFKTLYKHNSSAFPMTMKELSDYIWIQQALLNLFAIWIYDNSIFEDIISGQVAYQFARPIDLYNNWFANNLAMRLARTLLRCFLLFIIPFFIPEPYGLNFPQKPILFLITLVLAALLIIAFLILVYISVFYLLSATGIRVLVTTLGEFLTGAIIPLPFLPHWLQKLIQLTPFAYMQNIPLRVYSGHIQEWTIIIPQLFWLLILILIGRVFLSRAIGQVVIQGG